MRRLSRHRIAVIELGYVGLPLAVEFGKKYRTVGFPGCTEEICVPVTIKKVTSGSRPTTPMDGCRSI
jgi:UDP-N-acetyl-D-mannosaminuronate dehydrogenase